MKKIFIFTLALIIVLFSAFSCLAYNINRQKDDVTFRELRHKGDYELLDGVTLNTRAAYDNRLIWDMETKMGEVPYTETDFAFHYNRQNENYPRIYSGIYTDTYAVLQEAREYDNPAMKKLFPKAASKIKELYEEIPLGEEKEFIVCAKDLMDYYPFGNRADLPVYFPIEHIFFLLMNDQADEIYPKEIELLRTMEEQFKVPVLDDDRVVFSMEKNLDGSMGGIGINLRQLDCERFPFTTETVYTDEDIYFIFDAHTVKENLVDGAYTVEENLVDLSQLAHPYGIYKIPYDEENIYADKIEVILERDPGERPQSLCEDGENLIYAYKKGDKTLIDIIDMETSKVKDTVSLEDNISYMHLEAFDGFAVMNYSVAKYDSENVWTMEDQRIGVLEKKDDSYFVSFTCPKYTDDDKDIDMDISSVCYAYDGKRLVKAGTLRREYLRPDGLAYKTYDAPDIALRVYTDEGLKFLAEYKSSLTAGYTDSGNEYRFQVHGFYPNVEVSIEN